MNTKIEHYRMEHCLWKLLVVLSLVAPGSVRAVVQDSAPGTMMYCNSGGGCIYTSAMAAAEAVAAAYNENNLNQIAYDSCEDRAPGALRSLYSSPFGNRTPYVPGYWCHYYNYGYGDGAILTGPAYITNFPIVVTCPAPSYNPEVPYQYFDIYTSTCIRYVQNAPNITITITGGTETEPSNNLSVQHLLFVATVVNNNTGQPPATPVAVKVSLKVDPTSGGHDHGDQTRPRGGIADVDQCPSDIADVDQCPSDETCWTGQTDANGQVAFNFNAPEAAGTHTIMVVCDKCSNSASKKVDVKVAGLKPIPPSGLYALYEADGSVIGAVWGKHSSNHYLTTTSIEQLLVLAINYHHHSPNNPALHINDASLMWGGKFDISGKWSGYHYEHSKGTVVDIRANTAPGNIPEVNFTDFENLAAGQGLDAQLHCSATRDPSIDNCAGDANRHYHVILN